MKRVLRNDPPWLMEESKENGGCVLLVRLHMLTLERGGCLKRQRFLVSAQQAECGCPRSACSYEGGVENLRCQVRKMDIQPSLGRSRIK